MSVSAPFCVELSLLANDGVRHRTILSTVQREFQVTHLHAKVPLGIVCRGVWNNLCLDVHSLLVGCFPSALPRSIDSIAITSSSKLRKVLYSSIASALNTVCISQQLLYSSIIIILSCYVFLSLHFIYFYFYVVTCFLDIHHERVSCRHECGWCCT